MARNRNKRNRRYRMLSKLLAVVVVFTTTYGMILPAVTVERDAAREMAGVYLDEEAAVEEVSGYTGTDGEAVSSSREMTETGQDGEVEILDGDELIQEVEVNGPESVAEEVLEAESEIEPVEEVPEGPEPVVEEMPGAESELESVAEEMPESEPESVAEEMLESEPESVAEEMPESEPESVAEEMLESEPESVEEEMPESEPESVEEEMPESEPESIAEEMEESDPESIAEEPESEENDTEDEDDEITAAAGSHVVPVAGADYVLYVDYDPEAGIPAGAVVIAEAVDDEACAAEALELVQEQLAEENGTDSREDAPSGKATVTGLFDLTFYAEGRVILPAGPVSIRVAFDHSVENETLYAVHFPGTGAQPATEAEDEGADETDISRIEEETLELSESLKKEAGLMGSAQLLGDVGQEEGGANVSGESLPAELMETTTGERSVSFTADSFSYFVIVSYAVDSRYETYALSGDADAESTSVTVTKEWYDEGTRITDAGTLSGLTAAVQLVRYREENMTTTVHLCFAGSKIWTEKAAVDVPQGTVVTVHIQMSDWKDIAVFEEMSTDKEPYELTFNTAASGNNVNVTLNTKGKSDIYLVYRYGDTTVQDLSYVPDADSSGTGSGPVIDPTYTEENVLELNAENDWEAVFSNLPYEGDVDGVHYLYSYGVREISCTKGYAFLDYGTAGVNEAEGDADIPASLPAETIVVSNSKVQPGSLTLSKISDYDGADAAEKTYRIALKDLDGIYINPDGTEADGTDPVWVEFKDGDDKTWTDLPAGKYTIEEEDASVEGLSWSWTVADADGTVSKDMTVTVQPGDTPTEATVNNNYSEPVNVSLQKTWDSHVTADMAWEATFVLEELEYPYDSSYNAETAHDDADTSGSWEEVTPRVEFTVSSDSADIPELTNLPRFRTKDDGKTYILMYSVTETGYKVWESSDKTADPVYQWSQGGGYAGDVHFTPEYVEDASEYTDYTIEIINSEKNEAENIFIDFDLTKVWAPEGDPALTEESYAIFQLKRMSHQEFKNMNDPEVDYTRFVTVRIVDAAGREITSYDVEKNAYIKLQAGFKAGIDGVGTVQFENVDGSTGHVLIENGSALSSQALVASQPFRVDSDATFRCISGENYLADGIYGVVISDRCDGAPTADADDAAFNAQDLRFRVDSSTGHIVSYSNGSITDTTGGATPWRLDFQGFPQTLVDTGTVRQTTTVYGYYFEEVESSPDWEASFYQADASGNKTGVVNGNADNRIYFDDHVVAENKKPHLTIKKYWESLIQSEMPNVVIDIKQVTSDGNNINASSGSPTYKQVILTAENNFEYDLYDFPVSNGSGQYYAYVPFELGVTASKPGDDGVAADGTITDPSKVSYVALDSSKFGSPTYILAKDGTEINYVRTKADNLDKEQVQNFDGDIKRSVVTTGTGTVALVNNPKKFPSQMDIRKRWHMFTDEGGMTTESDYDGAYFTVMIVQIVKDAETGEEVKRLDYGTEFEWHYTGNNSFHYYDNGHEGNVSIDYHNGTWHVTIHEGSGHDGSNLPLYGYYTDADGNEKLAEYDYTFREVSITSTDGYHWAVSDHIQESSQQGSGHQYFLDNYPDADLKIVKHWPNKPSKDGTTAVYFKITDGSGNNVLKEIAESKQYREHQLSPADLVEYNGEWCLVVRGSADSTDDWIGYIDHLDLFDFSDTVFGDGTLPAGAMPGSEMSYNVEEVAVVQNGQVISGSYIPYYQVTTRGTKGSIRSSASGIQLGMNVRNEDGSWSLQPTIVEVTNNSTTDLEVEKRFFEKEANRKPVQVDPSEMTEWITEDGTAISRIEYVVRVDTYLVKADAADTASDTDGTADTDTADDGSSEEPIAELSGYLTEGWKTGESLAADLSGAAVFTIDVTQGAESESAGVYWSSKPDALQGLPSAKMVSQDGGEPLIYRYVYTIIEKAVYAGDQEVNAFSSELEYDSTDEVWKLNNTRTKDEYTPFEFTKEWQNAGMEEAADWPEGKEITVQVTRTKNGGADSTFSLIYTITDENKESTEISADSGSVYPDSGEKPKLQYQTGTKYTYKLDNLLKKHESDEYVYTVKETGTVEGYVNQNPDGVLDKGKIVNKKAGGVYITVLKVDENGDALDQVVFRLQKNEGSWQDIKSIKEEDAVKYADVTGIDDKSSFTSGTAAVTIGKLPDGEYRLVEDSTKPGYIILQKEIDFTINDGVLEGADIEGVVIFTKADEEKNTLALITITNTPGAALPNTGGPGTTLIYFIGLMLTAFAGAALVMRRKRRAA